MGQIYDEFDREAHVVDFPFQKERYKIIIGGQDWGYTHKGVLLVIGITKDDDIDIIDEHAIDRVPVAPPAPEYTGDTWVKIAKEFHAKYNFEMVYAGPDEPSYINTYNLNDIPCDKADNEVGPGIQTVMTLMHIDDNKHCRYRIHPRCKNLIQNKKAQVWKANKEGGDSETPDKKNDDSNDAERYALHSARHWLDISL
jgi:hypothetical protein